MSPSPLTASSRSRARGTEPFASGTSTPAPPPAASSRTRRMSSRWPSLPTTARLSLALATRRSSSGTRWASASTRFRRTATPSGSHASVSPPRPPTLSSSHAVGTSSSRYGTSPIASCAPTLSATPATSTLSLSRPMARSAHPAVRTAPPCSGISTRASTCTRLSRAMSSTRWSSRPTATGSAPPPHHASRSGTSSPSRLSTSSCRISRLLARRPPRTTASPSAGRPTARPCSRATLMARSACGRSALAAKPARSGTRTVWGEASREQSCSRPTRRSLPHLSAPGKFARVRSMPLRRLLLGCSSAPRSGW
mmetsp:Transcript_14890/g.18686  ORF Transcript_14890/g.18686 Transcript_14890/m.18686 type:complete len:310 (+) Transcript_14890:183-1112(+)